MANERNREREWILGETREGISIFDVCEAIGVEHSRLIQKLEGMEFREILAGSKKNLRVTLKKSSPDPPKRAEVTQEELEFLATWLDRIKRDG